VSDIVLLQQSTEVLNMLKTVRGVTTNTNYRPPSEVMFYEIQTVLN